MEAGHLVVNLNSSHFLQNPRSNDALHNYNLLEQKKTLSFVSEEKKLIKFNDKKILQDLSKSMQLSNHPREGNRRYPSFQFQQRYKAIPNFLLM